MHNERMLGRGHHRSWTRICNKAGGANLSDAGERLSSKGRSTRDPLPTLFPENKVPSYLEMILGEVEIP